MIISSSKSGKRQLVYIGIVNKMNRTTGMAVRKRGDKRPVYAFDLWEVTDVNTNWRPLWLASYDDNYGNEVFTTLPTGFPISKLLKSQSAQQIFKANLSFSPLVPGYDAVYGQTAYQISNNMPYITAPPTWEAETLIYNMSVYPALPMVTNNTLSQADNSKLIGPLFAENISFSCKEGGSVSIDCKFSGGKALRSPAMTFSPPTIDRSVYRSANFIDCHCILNSGDNIVSFVTSPRIAQMNLEISQQYDFTFTSNRYFADTVGARFISLNNRNVTGSIAIQSRESAFDIENYSSSLIMYFGGPFYFQMDNLKWQSPTSVIEIGGGYLHTYNFVALADPNASLSFDGFNLSEFNLDHLKEA